MNAPAIVQPGAFTHRLAEALLARARGGRAFLLAAQWRLDGLLCVLDDGSGLIGAKVPGEFEPFEAVTGYVSKRGAMEVVGYAIDRADEDARNERFALAISANAPEIMALFRANFAPPKGSSAHRVAVALGLLDPDHPDAD